MKKIVPLVCGSLLAVPFDAYSVDFTLFGDVVYSVTSADKDSQTFTLGDFDLIAGQEIGDATFVTAELVFEDPGHGFEVDVERFSVSRTFNPLLTVGLGRYHTQLGIWNQNFHHGSLIQDTITRPFFLEFEDDHGGIFPNHIVGLHVSGDTDKFAYQFGYANSNGIDTTGSESHPGETTLNVINGADPSQDKAVVLRVAYRGLGPLDEIGAFYMLNHVTELGIDNPPDSIPLVAPGEILFEQQIAGIDLRYTGEKLYSLLEIFSMTNQDHENFNSTTYTSNPEAYQSLAYYWQIGYHVTNRLSAIGRYEYLDYDDNATYFQLLDIPRQERTVLAFNYKLQESNSLRFEYSKTDPEGASSIVSYGVQWFFILF